MTTLPIGPAQPRHTSDPRHQSAAKRVKLSGHSPSVGALVDNFNGETTDVNFRALVGQLPADELTHALYPYPARLLRQIPRMFLDAPDFADRYDYLVDPFCGSGTVLLEAQRTGLTAFGFDQNPVAALISRVKTTPRYGAQLCDALESLIHMAKTTRSFSEYPPFLQKWYSHESVSILTRLKSARTTFEDTDVTDYLDVVIALFARQVSCADPQIPVPVRMLEKTELSSFEQWELFGRIGFKVLTRIERLPRDYEPARVTHCDAREASGWDSLPRDGRGVVFTSPPYGAAQKYIRSTSLEAGWLGYASRNGTVDMAKNSIGREHLTLADKGHDTPIHSPEIEKSLNRIGERSPHRELIYRTYFRDMRTVFQQIAAKPSIQAIVLVSGENSVAGMQLGTGGHLRILLEKSGFTRSLSLQDTIRGRSLLTSRKNTAPPIKTELIEMFTR